MKQKKETPLIIKGDGYYYVKFLGVAIEYTSNTLPETLKFLKKRYPTAKVEKKKGAV
jgi:predicted secreted hydrolase